MHSLFLHVERGVKKWREGVDDGGAKRVLARNHVAREHTPSSLSIANSMASGECINRKAQFNSFIHHLPYQFLREKQASGLAVRTATCGIRGIGPIFKEYAAGAPNRDDVEAAFQADEILPRNIFPAGFFRESISAITRAGHDIGTSERRMADAAFGFDADDFKLRVGVKGGAEDGNSFPYGVELGTASAANSHDNLFHGAGLTKRNPAGIILSRVGSVSRGQNGRSENPSDRRWN